MERNIQVIELIRSVEEDVSHDVGRFRRRQGATFNILAEHYFEPFSSLFHSQEIRFRKPMPIYVKILVHVCTYDRRCKEVIPVLHNNFSDGHNSNASLMIFSCPS